MDTINEYRVKVSVRNNLILQAIEDAGYVSVAGFCRAMGIHKNKNQLNALITFRTKPINNDGRFKATAIALMEALGAAPADLWTAEQLNLRLTSNSALTYVAQDDIRGYLGMQESTIAAIENPEQVLLNKERAEAVVGMLEVLTPREAKVLQLRFGIEGSNQEHTLKEVGEMMYLSPERIRQIEQKAFRKIRRFRPADELLETGVLQWT